jgi:hypothetical protein
MSEDVQRSELVHISILSPPSAVIGFVRDVYNWKSWAPWIRAVERSSERDWVLDTDAGAMKLHFVEANSFGVLDHVVALASGVRAFNPMRVVPNGRGSELMMVVFHRPDASDEEFDRDVAAVRADFARLRVAAEARRDRPEV